MLVVSYTILWTLLELDNIGTPTDDAKKREILDYG